MASYAGLPDGYQVQGDAPAANAPAAAAPSYAGLPDGYSVAPPQTSQALGFEQGVGRVIANGASVGDWLGRKLGLPMDKFWGEPFAAAKAQVANPDHDPNVQPGATGRFVGEMPAYFAGSALGPLGAGAVGGALTSDADSATGVVGDAVKGGLLSKGGDMALGAAQRVLAPKLSPAVQTLLNAKIPLTPGQTLGGAIKGMEDKLTSVPILGDLIGSAQKRATEGFNTERLNTALAPIGAQLPANMAPGRGAVDYVASTIGDAYDNILPKMQGAIDPKLQADVSDIHQSAIGEGARQETLDRFKNIVDAQIVQRADQSGMLTGDALKQAQSNLGKLGSKFAASTDADDRQLGSMLLDTHSAFGDMLARQNPASAPDLQAANSAFAQYARIRRAASSVGAKDGVFSAPQYANAVKALDKSAGKGAYARGNALGQDMSDAANQVLPSLVPDSGTAGRGIGAALAMGALTPHALGTGLLGSALYTDTGQAALRTVLSGNRPGWALPVANMIGTLRKPIGLAPAALLAASVPPQD